MPGSPVAIDGFRGSSLLVPPGRSPRYTISGITRDALGQPLAGCTVEIYEAGSGLLRGNGVSGADGTYSLDVTGPDTGLTFYVAAFLPGASEVAGITVDTLVGVDTS